MNGLTSLAIETFPLAPAPRQPFLDVIPRQHLLAELPSFALRDDVAGVPQVERVRLGTPVGIPVRPARHWRSSFRFSSWHRRTASSQSVVSRLNLISAGMPNVRYFVGTRRRNHQNLLRGLFQGSIMRKLNGGHSCVPPGVFEKPYFEGKRGVSGAWEARWRREWDSQAADSGESYSPSICAANELGADRALGVITQFLPNEKRACRGPANSGALRIVNMRLKRFENPLSTQLRTHETPHD
jgi:hypothetical protein